MITCAITTISCHGLAFKYQTTKIMRPFTQLRSILDLSQFALRKCPLSSHLSVHIQITFDLNRSQFTFKCSVQIAFFYLLKVCALRLVLLGRHLDKLPGLNRSQIDLILLV